VPSIIFATSAGTLIARMLKSVGRRKAQCTGSPQMPDTTVARPSPHPQSKIPLRFGPGDGAERLDESHSAGEAKVSIEVERMKRDVLEPLQPVHEPCRIIDTIE
jgi:hypothetical protein